MTDFALFLVIYVPLQIVTLLGAVVGIHYSRAQTPRGHEGENW